MITATKSTPRDTVPWTFTDSAGTVIWTWLTEHFVARIVGAIPHGDTRAVRSVDWEIGDLVHRHQGAPRVIVEGRASHFDEAADAVIEHVAKAYDPSCGYRRFAGSLAFTYLLASGERFDVSSFIGRPVSVHVLEAAGTVRIVHGEFLVHGYRWRVLGSQGTSEIVPEHVVRIHERMSEGSAATESVEFSPTATGFGRIHRDVIRRGCTGTPGFMAGTIDHASAEPCPIHEEGIRHHLLD